MVGKDFFPAQFQRLNRSGQEPRDYFPDGSAEVQCNEFSTETFKHHPVRVVHVAHTIAGGIASFFEEIAPYQNAAFGKSNVKFLIPSGSESHLPSIDPAQIITIAATSRKPGALLTFGRAANESIKQLKPDILHLHSSFAGALLRILVQTGPKKPCIIYCPHGWAFSMETSTLRKWIYAAVERVLARRTSLLLVNSESEHDLAISFGLPRAKVRTVKNGVCWTPAPNANGKTGPLSLAFIGRHDRQKGIDILLETIERFSLRHIHFHIVGESVLGAEHSDPPFARDNVTFHGWLSRVETMKLLHHVDGIVMPSRWDAAPIVAIEAMRAGVAIIGSNRGALPEIIQDGVGGYIFDINEADSLGRLLERIDADELRRLGMTARARWESEYDADRMNRLTVEAYESVLPVSARATKCCVVEQTDNVHVMPSNIGK